MPTYSDLSKSDQEKQDGYRDLIKNSVLKDFVVNNDLVLKSNVMLKTSGNFSGVKVRIMALNSALYLPYEPEEYQKLAADLGLTLVDTDTDFSLSLALYENSEHLAELNNQAQFVALYRLLQQGLQPKQALPETQTFDAIAANVKDAILRKNRSDAVVIFNALSTFVFNPALANARERIEQAIAYIEDATGKSLTKFSELLEEVLVPSVRQEAATEAVGETFQQKLNRILQEQADDPRYQESYQEKVELATASKAITPTRVSPVEDTLRSQMAKELKSKILADVDTHEVNPLAPVGGPEQKAEVTVKEAAVTVAPDPKGYRAWIAKENPLLGSFIGGQEVSNTEKHKAPGTFATTQNRVAALLTTPYIIYTSTEYRQLLDNLKLTVSPSQLTTLVASNLTQVRNLSESSKADIVGAYKVIYSALREAGAEGKGDTSKFMNNLLTDTNTAVQQYKTITDVVKDAIMAKDQSGKLTAWHLMQDLLQHRLSPQEVADKVFVKANEGMASKFFGFGKKAALSEKEQLVVALTALLTHSPTLRHTPPSLLEVQHGLSSLGHSDAQEHKTVQLEAQGLGVKEGVKKEVK